MHQDIFFGAAVPQWKKEKKTGERTAADMIKEGIARMEEATLEVTEEERAALERQIRWKLKNGRQLTAKELNYLRIHDPETYRTAIRVERARKNLRNELKRCRSKEEVNRVISNQLAILKSMKSDPDLECMAAMVQKEIEEFKKSNAYARLPETAEEGKKKHTVHQTETRDDKDILSVDVLSVTVLSYKQCEVLSGQLEKLATE